MEIQIRPTVTSNGRDISIEKINSSACIISNSIEEIGIPIFVLSVLFYFTEQLCSSFPTILLTARFPLGVSRHAARGIF